MFADHSVGSIRDCAFIRANRQLRVPADVSESATKPCGRDMPLLHSPAIPRPLACLERARKYPIVGAPEWCPLAAISGAPRRAQDLRGMIPNADRTCNIRKLRNNIRIMRKNAPVLDSLFPNVRQGVLAATLIRPEKWWYLSELAEFLHTRPSSLQRELRSLAQSGILEQRRDGRRTYFKAEMQSPIFRELRSIFEKTVGLIPTLRIALRPFAGKIVCAFVYGSIARREELATSDVDLMVIGSVGLADLAPSLGRAEKRLGREVNVTSYSVEEFRKKVTEGDHFLRTVLKGSIQFVKGEQRDLDAVVGK